MKSNLTTLCALFVMLLAGVSVAHAEDSLSLAGNWRFSRDESKSGVTQKWYAGELKTEGEGPSEISLPGTTDQAKAGKPNPKPPGLDGLYRPNVYVGPGVVSA